MALPRPTRDYDHLFKLVLIGDSGVGKSCLLLRFAVSCMGWDGMKTLRPEHFCIDELDEDTIRQERFRTITVDSKVIKLQIWDTAGQERFRTITSAYYRGADGIVMVYDTTDKTSFAHIDDWLSEVNRYANESTCKILVGNKCDLNDDKQVTTEDAQKKAEDLGIAFIETSAKDATNVEQAFTLIARELIHLKESVSFASTRPVQGVKISQSPSADNRGLSTPGGCSC